MVQFSGTSDFWSIFMEMFEFHGHFRILLIIIFECIFIQDAAFLCLLRFNIARIVFRKLIMMRKAIKIISCSYVPQLSACYIVPSLFIFILLDEAHVGLPIYKVTVNAYAFNLHLCVGMMHLNVTNMLNMACLSSLCSHMWCGNSKAANIN